MSIRSLQASYSCNYMLCVFCVEMSTTWLRVLSSICMDKKCSISVGRHEPQQLSGSQHNWHPQVFSPFADLIDHDPWPSRVQTPGLWTLSPWQLSAPGMWLCPRRLGSSLGIFCQQGPVVSLHSFLMALYPSSGSAPHPLSFSSSPSCPGCLQTDQMILLQSSSSKTWFGAIFSQEPEMHLVRAPSPGQYLTKGCFKLW